MKLKQLTVATCLLVCMLALQTTLHAEGKPVNTLGEKEKKAAKAKVATSRNNSSIKIYPDPLRRIMHVVAKEEGKEIDFFVFDLEGSLVKHYKMKNGEHQKLSGLERGKYTYNVFSGDEETAAGQLEIR
jgi:hypothetical protein